MTLSSPIPILDTKAGREEELAYMGALLYETRIHKIMIHMRGYACEVFFLDKISSRKIKQRLSVHNQNAPVNKDMNDQI